MEYTTQMKQAEIAVSDYLDKYVRAEEFIQYCRACPNFGKIWSCPEYDFDTMEYFRKHSRLRVIGLKIIYSAETRKKTYSREEMRELIEQFMNGEIPLTCPHGRPVVVRITRSELEKMFRRIV